jgi:hypothetical protein
MLTKKCGIVLIAGLCLVGLSGCSDNKVSAKEEQTMRKQLTQKFDINNVPPNQRSIVEGYMRQYGRVPVAPPSPGATKPTK